MEEKSDSTMASYESPSMGEMLKQVHSKEVPKDPAPEPSTEPKQEHEVAVTEKKDPEPPKAEEAPKREETTPQKDESVRHEERMVPLSALKAERERRRAADAALAALKAQGLSPTHEMPVEEQPQESWGGSLPTESQIPVRSNFELLTSEKLARLEHPDYDDKYKAFEEHAATALKAGDRSLVNSILASDHPGEAAYVAGRMLLEGQKYGFDVLNDPTRYREAVRQDLEKEIRAEIGSKEKSTVASRISDRSKTPTDIGLAKSAPGSSASEYSSPSMTEMLARVQKSKKRS